MKMLTPADAPSTTEVINQVLTVLTLWKAVLTPALVAYGGAADLDNLLLGLAAAAANPATTEDTDTTQVDN